MSNAQVMDSEVIPDQTLGSVKFKIERPEVLDRFREEIRSFHNLRQQGECPSHLQGKSDKLVMLEIYESLVAERRRKLAGLGNIYMEKPLVPSTVIQPRDDFSYHPDTTEIRLLVFEPQDLDDGSSLTCSMKLWDVEFSVMEGSSLHIYNTLSYRWDQNGEKKVLMVDGHEMEISNDLDLALRSILRSRPANATVKELILWIDAICINQNDDNERSQQVAMMTYTYSCCAICLIWLGPSRHDSEVALDLLDEVFKTCRIHRDEDGLEGSSIWSTLRQISVDETQRQSITAFFSRDYWERLWIVQEILLSRTKRVFCGEKSFGWEWLGCFTHLYQNATSSEELAVLMQTKGQKARDLVSLDKSFDHAKRLSLLEGLFISQNRKSSDMRDAVFAILGITRSMGLAPKYYKFASDAMVEAALRIMDQERSFNVLSMVHVQDPEKLRKRWDKTEHSVRTLWQNKPQPFEDILDVDDLKKDGYEVDRLKQDYERNIKQEISEEDFARATWVSWCPPQQGDVSCLPTWAPNWSGNRSVDSHILFSPKNGKLDKRDFNTTPKSFPSYWQSSSGGSFAGLLPEATFGLEMAFTTVCLFVDSVDFVQHSSEKGDVINSWLLWNDHLDSLEHAPYPTIETRAAAFARAILFQDHDEPVEIGDHGHPLGNYPALCNFLTRGKWRLEAKYQEPMDKYTAGKPGSSDKMVTLPMVRKNDDSRPPNLLRFMGGDGNDSVQLAAGQQMNLWMDTLHNHFAIFFTTKGYIGVGVKGVMPGDRVCIVPGCDVPLVLRKTPPAQKAVKRGDGKPVFLGPHLGLNAMPGSKEPIVERGQKPRPQYDPTEHWLIGECYLDGVMHGEFVTEDGSWEEAARLVSIV